MKYLFIVTESESANGICTKAVMKQLAAEHEVYCITNREWGMPEQFAEDGITFCTVKPRLVYRISSMLTRRELPLRQRKILQKLNRVLDRGKLVLSLGIWPLLSPAYARRIEKVARKLCRDTNIDCIIPIYTQIDTLIAASRIKKTNKDIFYIPYFLDSLSGGYGLRVFTPEQTRNRALAWERRLLPNADWIIAMESSRAHHAQYSASENYYDRILFYDLPLLRTELPAPAAPLFSSQNCNIVYVGTLPSGIRSPEYILKVFQYLKGARYQLYFVGTSDCAELNEAAQKDPRIHVVGRCSHEAAMQYEMQADILVNIGNTNPYMTPSKIFEYMSFGKPILSAVAVDREPSRHYLEKYPQALILDERERDYEKAAESVCKMIARSAAEPVDLAGVHEVFYKNTPGAMADFLEKLDRSQTA